MAVNDKFPVWVPKEVKDHLARNPYLVKESSTADGYAPIRRIVFDESLMPKIWRKLQEKEASIKFLFSLVNDISFWMMKDKTAPSQKEKLYEAANKNISKLIDAIAASADLQFECQMLFEDAIYQFIGKRPVEVMQGNPSQIKAAHFLSVLQVMEKELAEITVEPPTPSDSIDSVYPRKMNEKSSFRTYLARCLSKSLEDIFGKRNPQMVVSILQVMLDDPDGISEDHLRKLLKN